MLFFKEKDEWEIVEQGKVTRQIKAYNDEIMMVDVKFENEAIGELHTHPHSQATYCLEGEFEFTVDGESLKIKEGDSVYMPPYSLHGCKLLSKKGRLLDVFTPYREDFLNENK